MILNVLSPKVCDILLANLIPLGDYLLTRSSSDGSQEPVCPLQNMNLKCRQAALNGGRTVPKITKRAVDALPLDGQRHVLWDAELKGFGVIAHPGGTLAFVVQYRNAEGRQRRLTLGRYGPLSVEQAREAAQEALFCVMKGGDPVANRIAMRTAPTMNDLFDRYLKDHVELHNAASTRATVQQILKNHLRPRLGTIKACAVTRADIARVHTSMKMTPRHANYALSVLSKVFVLAELWGHRPEHSNPTRGITRYAETHRTRFLSGFGNSKLGSCSAGG